MKLETLGVASLHSSSGSEPVLGPGKTLALLIYVALTPGRRISREFLVELLWADLDPTRARNALRQTLFHLRRLLGDGALAGTDELTLATRIESDRDQFLLAIENGDLEKALEIYAGDFLPAFGVPGGALFEQWADLERDRLRAAFLRSAEILVRRQLNHSRFREAQRIARRVRDLAPDAEAAWRLVLETAIASRDFVSASVEAQALEQRAASEEITLEPATIKSIARARRASSYQSDVQEDASLAAELTGREREFSSITLAWESARSGRAKHIHLTAPAGIGKTRLLRDAVARLRAAGTAVVECRALPGDRDIPYALAGDVAGSIAALRGSAGVSPASASVLIALNPAVSSFINGHTDQSAGDDVLRRRVQALTDLVNAVADEHPFVLAIDDMHWADALSFQTMEGVIARLQSAHVLCLTAARPDCVIDGDGVTTLRLAPLTPQQVASFVSALGVLPSGESWAEDLVAGMHSATRGSPLLILETLRLAMSEEILTRENGEWKCHDQSKLGTLLRTGEALIQRLKALPENQRWVLALLATAGTPLSRESLATAVGASPDALSTSLASLEINGWVSRLSDKWILAHDEIARAGRDAMTPEQLVKADALIGSLLLNPANAGTHDIMRGIRHMIAANRDEDVARQFRRYALLVREKRDKRPFARIASEAVGEVVDTPRVKSLVHSLPVAWRIGLWNKSRQRVAASVAGMIALGGWGVARASASADANLVRLVYADTTRTAQAFVVRPREWDGRRDPVAGRRTESSFVDAALAFPDVAPVVSPDGKTVAWNQNSGDSTTIDIWIRTPAGVRRLTNHVRDDLVFDWLPDGSALVGVTSRWSSIKNGNYDVALFDTATGAARPITRGPDHDGKPRVSPDGARIAFLREPPDGPALVCVVPVDGRREPECRKPGGHPSTALAGWRNAREIVAIVDADGARKLVRYDWQHDQETSLFDGEVVAAILSPDRRWIAATARVNGVRGLRDWIIPVDDPASARMVNHAPSGVQAQWWEGGFDNSEVINRIEFVDSLTTILPGIGTRLRIRAFSSANVELPVLAPITWTSSDTTIAVVDSTGNVRPRGSGAVTIEASLSGWRKVRRRFSVRASPPSTVAREAWDSGWRSRWITFGDPQPTVTTGPAGIASFWNRGDGSYQSFGILRRAFDAHKGLGIEIRMSTPLMNDGDHRARVFLVADIDTAAYRSANQHKEPPSLGRTDAVCGAVYPTGNGSFGRSRLAGTGGSTRSLDVSGINPSLASGDWWTLRIQILPDGRCGIAVNNHVLWLSAESIALDGKFFLRLGDQSRDAKLLHGPLEMWTGVKTDIDWSSH